MVSLGGKIAVVTGAGSGIGKAIALRFAREGAKVFVNDVVEERVSEVLELCWGLGLKAAPAVADVTRIDDVERLVAYVIGEAGRVDILVNNAGASFGDDILKLTPEDWDRNLRLVLTSVFYCCRAVLPIMLKQRSGVIINISSVNGLTGFGEEAYSAGKAGVNNLTLNLAVRYGPAGIRVNAICPGTVRTPIWSERVARDPEIFERLAEWYPLRRVGEPDDVAAAAAFLASDEASWITGVILPVDGGLMAGNLVFGRLLQAEGLG